MKNLYNTWFNSIETDPLETTPMGKNTFNFIASEF